MATSANERIGAFLGGVGSRGSFAARRTAGAGDLHIEVRGIGPLRFPVPQTQAKQLCRIARPARYGRGEETLLDERVRNTGQIPKSRVRIDARRWNRTLLPVLDQLRRGLGLPEDRELKAELHSMLVYEPGQFFLPHQDSEKSDDMVGTLVVTLPSAFRGGAFVIEHMGETVTYRGSKQPLSFIAFYADCRHEVRPVTHGYRIVLTYNLTLKRERSRRSGMAPDAATNPERTEPLAALLHAHFTTSPPRESWERDATPREPPNRLVYLLDHQYTERGLAWDRLKGADAARVAALAAAADRAGCDTALALADVHECRECEEWEPPSHRSWYRADEDDDWDSDDEPQVDDPAGYTIGDLLEGEIALTRWLDRGAKKAESIATYVHEEEVCSTTPSSALEPYASEYEGYMGNYGNTLDRWYRRAALVVWPRDRTFAVLAEISPARAMATLQQQIRAGDIAEARAAAASLLPFWENVAPRVTRRGFVDRVLSVAEGMQSRELATSLLAPFRVEALRPGHARTFAALVERYGERWTRALLSSWSSAPELAMDVQKTYGPGWFASLPQLCAALCAERGDAGPLAAHLILEDRWNWLRASIESASGVVRRRERDDTLQRLAPALLTFLEAAVGARARNTHHVAMAMLLAERNEPLLPLLIATLRHAAESLAPELRRELGLAAMQRRCIDLLQAHLDAPARAADDWSLTAPVECGCELCRALATFLAAPGRTHLEWPLAKEKRRHVHDVIDGHDLPVRHETRRSGSPFTLVLTKLPALFEREAAERRAWKSDLDWLRRTSF